MFGRLVSKGFDVAATYTLLYNTSLLVEGGMGVAICLDGVVEAEDETPFAFVPLADAPITPMHVSA